MAETNEETIVINDLLSFISCKIKFYPRDRLIKCLKEFYSDGAASEAETTLAASLPDNASHDLRKQKEKNIFARLYDSFSAIPENELPIFVCKNLNNVPKFEVDSDECQDDQDNDVDEDDSEDLISEQKFIKAQIAEISTVVYQLKDQIQLLATQRSKNKSSTEEANIRKRKSSSKSKVVETLANKPKVPTYNKFPKGLAYLQTLIDQEEEEKVKRLSTKQEPKDDIFSDIDENDKDDDENDIFEDDDDDNTVQLIANRRQRALVKNVEAEVFNGKLVASPIKRMQNISTKRKVNSINTSKKKLKTELVSKDDETSDYDEDYQEAFGLNDDEDEDEEDMEDDWDDEDDKSDNKRSLHHEKSHIKVEEVTDANVGRKFSIYKCTLCNFSTNDEAAIERHDCPQIYSRNEEEEECNIFKYFCFECKFRGNNPTLFKKHLLKHPQSFACPICPEKIEDPDEWPEHVRDCIENENLQPDHFICNVCNVIYASANAVRIHRSNHEPVKPYECLICKYRFQTSEKLDSHFKLHQSKGYKCPFCFYVHKNKYTFFTHIRSHTGETPFACSKCEYRSTSITAVNAHMQTHSTTKDIECDMCPAHFKSKQKLNLHKKIHQKGSEHKCSECGKSFKTAWLLNVHHSNKHSIAQSYPCPICDFVAHSTEVLKDHMGSHDKVQIFNCSLCSYRTNYKTQLDDHLKKTHLGLN